MTIASIGQWLANVVIGLIAALFVKLTGGPDWAGVATALIVFNIWRATDFALTRKKSA